MEAREVVRNWVLAFNNGDADMVCQIENLFQDGDWAILEWSDPKGLQGCGYFNELSFLRQQGLPLPTE